MMTQSLFTAQSQRPAWSVEFFAPGICKTAGSKRAIPKFKVDAAGVKRWIKNIVTDDCEQGAGWRETVQAEAVKAMGGIAPVDFGLELLIVFVMPRPKYHKTKYGTLRPDAPSRHTSRPDATKLLRAVEDALNGIVWSDDARIADQHVLKKYGDRPGAIVRIRELRD